MQKGRLTEIADKAFDLSNTLEYTMSIRFIPNGFCFIVYARKHDGILYFLEVAEPGKSSVEVLRDYSQSHPVLKSSFSQVLFLEEDSVYELVPMGIFQDSDATAIWKLTHGELAPTMQLNVDSLKILDVNLIYALQSDLVQSVQSCFPTVRFLNRQSLFIQTSVMENRKHSDSNLFLNLHAGFVDVVVVTGGKLQMANSFAYRNTDEFLYFVLGIYDLFGLDQYKSVTTVAGIVDDELMAALMRYLKNIRVAARPSSLLGSFEKVEKPERYLNLFNIPLCVL
ncbi:MAG: DUF3822 family protein [Paludibacteraceae bacterium]|nr:DUF3822 family protein [Paludibacteraceae bacterium]